MGRFIVPSCRVAALETEVVLHNSIRDTDSEEDKSLKNNELTVNLLIVSQGKVLHKVDEFISIAPGQTKTVCEKDFVELFVPGQEYAFVFKTYYKGVDKDFSQEHQVLYRKRDTSKFATVLYDQFPNSLPNKVNPIILLAHKVWLSEDITTLVTLTNINEKGFGKEGMLPFHFSLLSQNGDKVFSREVAVFNETVVLDLSVMLKEMVDLNHNPQLFCLFAKGGGDGSCVINTIILNKNTSSLTVEHSLYPGYYVSGDRDYIRKIALEGIV